MIIQKLSIIPLAVSVVLLSSMTALIQYAAAQPLEQGNVIVSIGHSKYEVHDGISGAALFTINCTSVGPSTYTTGSLVDTANGFFYGTQFSGNAVCRTDLSGNSPVSFGSGFGRPESIVKDNSGNFYLGNLDKGIVKLNSTGGLVQTFTGAGRVDWIDLSKDQCTMFTTREDSKIRRYDVCNDTPFADFATGLSGSAAYALRILSDGGVLVADTQNIKRLNSTGNVVQTYDKAGINDWFAVNLDSDGTHFWSAGVDSGNVAKFDIVSGAVVLDFTPASFTKVGGLSVVGEITQLNDPCNGIDDNGNGIVDEGAVGTDDDGDGTVDEEADACVNISINDVSATEGDAGTKNFNFTVTRLGETSIASSVDFATADDTATVADSDYVAKNGTLNFAIGETSKTVTVVVNGDTTVEPDETFNVNLSNCIPNCEMVDGQGLGTIQNDDFAPGVPDVSINNVSQNEGNSGTTNFDFTVTRTGDLSGNSTVTFATADDTATQPSDYASNSGTVSFASGEATKTVTVVVNGDTTVETNETFNVDLANCAGCNISDNQGVGTILNDDSVIGDVDQDGVPDNIDQCPTVPGPAANNGCPVTQQVVGGEILGIDMASLFVAGAFANAGWIIPIAGVAAAGIVGFAIRKRIK